MTNKIYVKLKKYIKENYLFLIMMAIIIFLGTYTLDYEVYTPGGVINLEKRVDIDGVKKTESFYQTYVGGKKGIIPVILLSYIIPSWDLESIDDLRIEEESVNDITFRNKISMKNTDQNAIISAFDAANKPYQVTKVTYYVILVSEASTTDLKVGDEILQINGSTDISKELFEKEKKDSIFLVKRNKRELEIKVSPVEIEGQMMYGVYVGTLKEVLTDPKIIFTYKGNESGASGGLMSSLYIYSQIVDYDVADGRKISGTGTIDEQGNVGAIDGVKYKLAGAVKKNMDIFLCPSYNYKEAINLKEKNNYEIEIIEAITLSQVVEKLKR